MGCSSCVVAVVQYKSYTPAVCTYLVVGSFHSVHFIEIEIDLEKRKRKKEIEIEIGMIILHFFSLLA